MWRLVMQGEQIPAMQEQLKKSRVGQKQQREQEHRQDPEYASRTPVPTDSDDKPSFKDVSWTAPERSHGEDERHTHEVDDWETHDQVPDMSRLSLEADINPASRRSRSEGGAPLSVTPSAPDREPVSKGQLWRQGKGVPVTPSRDQEEHATSLSAYGVSLGDLRDFEDLPEEDVMAHGVHLSGFHSGTPLHEKLAVASTWTNAGATLTWLADGSAVVMLCSKPTAARALRQLSGDDGLTARGLKDCQKNVQDEAKRAGLVIPPRPRADTAASSRLIRGALGLRGTQPSYTPSPSKAKGGVTPSRSQGTPQVPVDYEGVDAWES